MAKSNNYQYKFYEISVDSYKLNKYLQPECKSEYYKELRDKLIKSILTLATKELPPKQAIILFQIHFLNHNQNVTKKAIGLSLGFKQYQFIREEQKICKVLKKMCLRNDEIKKMLKELDIDY